MSTLLIAFCACNTSKEGADPTAEDVEIAGSDATVQPDTSEPPMPSDVKVSADSADTLPESTLPVVNVTVTLDGEPAPFTLVMQAGKPDNHVHTDFDGKATIELDMTVLGQMVVSASHPEARQKGALIYPEFPEPEYFIALTRFDMTDNPDYQFNPAGEPGNSPTLDHCGHCHETIVEDWHASAHRTSASNPTVQDLYAGAVTALTDETTCKAAGGEWAIGLEPGTGEPKARCYKGSGVLETLNPGCDDDGPCDGKGTAFGSCADCHAPSINGKLGGRDLLEATGWAHEWGVQCESCHRVERVNLDKEPGVAGRLRVIRPTEKPATEALGEYAPLIFGPNHDNLNARMGSVQRDHFHEATLCAGCHEQEQPVLVPGVEINKSRWPSGRLPIHSTFSEWKDGPMNPAAPCQSCHMPPNPQITNSADQQLHTEAEIGIVAGWIRPPGYSKKHSWDGPRALNSGMLESAASVFVVSKIVADGKLTTTIKTKNTGPGHAIPTGEPMRSMALVISATCDGEPLEATGGDVVPDFGGYIAQQDKTGDWQQWPAAKPGHTIRVVKRSDKWRDYEGVGPFGDGTFNAKEKGMVEETYVGTATVVSVDAGKVTLDGALPEGDVAYLVDENARAGQPGFGFARVLLDQNGKEMVPHFLAVDVRSDNRLMPQKSATTTHIFECPCEIPKVTAQLYHRPYPYDLAMERGWKLGERLMVEVTK